MAARRLKQIGLLGLGALVATAMVLLGLWQLDVYRAQGQAVAAARAAEPAVPIGSVAVAGQAVGDGYGRTVRVTGRYDPELQLLIADPRGGPKRVLTALIQSDGSAVPVVRGTVPAGTTALPVPPAGPTAATGILLPSESVATGPAPAGSTGNGAPDLGSAPGSGLLSGVQLGAVAQRWSPPLVGGFVTLDATEATTQGLVPAPVALPEADGRLRNGAYALQWWIFAAFALLLAGRMARDLGRAEDLVALAADEREEHERAATAVP